MPPKKPAMTPSRATSEGADPARTPARGGTKAAPRTPAPVPVPAPAVSATPRTRATKSEEPLLEGLPDTSRRPTKRPQQVASLPPVDEERGDEASTEEDEENDTALSAKPTNSGGSAGGSSFNIDSTAGIGGPFGFIPSQNPTTPVFGSTRGPLSGVRPIPRASPPPEFHATPEEIAAANAYLASLPLPDSDEEDRLFFDEDEAGDGSPSVRGPRPGRAPPVNPFPTRSGSGASNNYSNRSSLNSSFSAGRRRSRSPVIGVADLRRPARGGNRRPSPGGDPPADVQTQAEPQEPPASWLDYFIDEVDLGLQYLYPVQWRWVWIMPLIPLGLRMVLCSAGSICETHSAWSIFWRYVFADTWETSINFLSLIVVWVMIFAQLYDYLTGFAWFLPNFIIESHKDNRGQLFWPSWTLQQNATSLVLFCWRFVTGLCDHCLESLMIPALSLALNRLGSDGPGNGFKLCAIMFGVHVVKWAVQATENWEQGWYISPARGPWKRWIWVGILIILVVVYRDLFTLATEAQEFVRGQGIRHSDATPTAAKHPVFSVTRITSVTGDMMTMLTSMLSSSGLSPVTTGK